jgi:uncharacterized membrane protein
MANVEQKATIGMIGYVAVAAIVAIVSSSLCLRASAAIPLVLFLPGYSVLRATIRAGRLDLQTLVFSIALSVAIDILGGLVLNAFDALSMYGWALWLCAVTVGACALSPLGVSPSVTISPRTTSLGLRPAQWAMCAAAVLIGTGAIGLARSGAANQHEYAFTEFWMVPNAASGGNVATVGISNQEKVATTYEIALFANGANVSRRSGIALQPGETWSDVIPLNGQLGRADRVEAWLFKADAPENVYRKVWLSNAVKSPTHTKDHG